MSKSTGNFLTLRQAIDKFSADGKLIVLERMSTFKWFLSDSLASHKQEKTMQRTNQEENVGCSEQETSASLLVGCLGHR